MLLLDLACLDLDNDERRCICYVKIRGKKNASTYGFSVDNTRNLKGKVFLHLRVRSFETLALSRAGPVWFLCVSLSDKISDSW